MSTDDEKTIVRRIFLMIIEFLVTVRIACNRKHRNFFSVVPLDRIIMTIEIPVAHKPLTQLPNEEGLLRIFQALNINKSGSIDLSELIVGLNELGVTTCLYTARRILESIDHDESGAIEFHDFARFFITASNLNEVKELLTQEAKKFIDYKNTAESGDPNFSHKFRIPPCYRAKSRFTGHLDVVQSVVWRGDLDFVSGSLDGSVALWSVSKSEPVMSFKPTGSAIYSMVLLGNSAFIGFGDSTCSLAAVNLDSGGIEREFLGYDGTGVTCVSIEKERPSHIVSGSTKGRCLIHDAGRSECIAVLLANGSLIEDLSIGEHSAVATGHHSGFVSLLDTRSASVSQTFEAALGCVSAVAFRSEYELITGGDDFIVRRFDIRKVTPIGGAIGSFLGHSSPVTSLEVFSDLVLSGAQDGSVRIWSDSPKTGGVKFADPKPADEMVDTSSAIGALIGHSQAVRSIACRSGGLKHTTEIITGSSDSVINKYSVVAGMTTS